MVDAASRETLPPPSLAKCRAACPFRTWSAAVDSSKTAIVDLARAMPFEFHSSVKFLRLPPAVNLASMQRLPLTLARPACRRGSTITGTDTGTRDHTFRRITRTHSSPGTAARRGLDTAIRNARVTIRNSLDTAIRSSLGTAIRNSLDTAIRSNPDMAVRSNPDMAVRSSLDTAIRNSLDITRSNRDTRNRSIARSRDMTGRLSNRLRNSRDTRCRPNGRLHDSQDLRTLRCRKIDRNRGTRILRRRRIARLREGFRSEIVCLTV
jgi:hypothetical protein